MHASCVLMLVKRLIHLPIYRLNCQFCCKCWLHSLDLFDSDDINIPGISVSLDITNKAFPRLSLEKFSKISVYK